MKTKHIDCNGHLIPERFFFLIIYCRRNGKGKKCVSLLVGRDAVKCSMLTMLVYACILLACIAGYSAAN